MTANAVTPGISTIVPSTMTARGSSKEIAREFESLMIAQLVKQMRQSGPEESGLFPGDSSDTFGGLFDLHMSQHLTEQGGFGLADSIERKLEGMIGNSSGGTTHVR